MWAIPTGTSSALKKKKKVKSPSIWSRTPNSVRIRQSSRTGNRGVTEGAVNTRAHMESELARVQRALAVAESARLKAESEHEVA